MHMEAFLWLFLPVFVAGGSALLSYYIMQARMEVALAKERESLAEARATITSQKITMEERIKAAEESTKRLAMDDFMQEFRVEERSYARESRSLTSSKKSMVMQERLFFRNIPLSNWIEHEMVVEEGLDLDQLPKESVFGAASAAIGSSNGNRLPVAMGDRVPISIAEGRLPISKMISEFGAPAAPDHQHSDYKQPADHIPHADQEPHSDHKPAPAAPREKTSLIPARVVAFGAQ
jgi:hypothetical protein